MSDAPVPPAAPAPPRKGLAVASLVLGLLSLPTLGLLFVGAILSLVFGIVALVKASRHPAQYGGQRLAVAGIVASVVSVLVMPVVLGVMAAIAIPTFLRKRVAANETAAIANVRQVMAAQQAYRARSGGPYGSAECLTAPASCLAGYDGPPFAEEADLAPANGYRYSLHGQTEEEGDAEADASGEGAPAYVSFAFVALPVAPGQTGVRAFCGDASGRLCFTTNGEMPEVEAGACPAEDCTDLR